MQFVVEKALAVAHMTIVAVLLAVFVLTLIVYIAGGPVVLALVRSVALQTVAVCMAAFIAALLVVAVARPAEI